MYKYIYMLDTCAIIHIKTYNEGKASSSLKKNIAILKRLDKKENLISGYLSGIEGLSGQQETSFKKSYTFINIAEELTKFYSSAKTDANALNNFSNTISSNELGSHEGSFERSLQFRNEVFDLLNPPPTAQRINKIKKDIDMIAMKYELLNNSLVYIICISALYGLNQSRNVLKLDKPKDKYSFYNALSDVFAMVRVSQLKSQVQQYLGCKIKFITFDKGLRYLNSKLYMENTHTTPQNFYSRDYEYSVSIPKTLFPKMTDLEYKSFIDQIGAK